MSKTKVRKIMLSCLIFSLALPIVMSTTVYASESTNTKENTASARVAGKMIYQRRKAKNGNGLPNTVYYNDGRYSGYLTLGDWEINRDGWWYGNYSGFCVAAPFGV